MAESRFPNLRQGVINGLAAGVATVVLLMCGAFVVTRSPQFSQLAEAFALYPWWQPVNWLRALAIAVLDGAAVGFFIALRPAPNQPKPGFNYLRLAIYLTLLLGVVGWDTYRRWWSPRLMIQTEHYEIQSSATPEQTEEIGRIAEILHSTYTEFVPDLDLKSPNEKLKLKLFKNREEFRFSNRIWDGAEAFYQRPYCYQYYSTEDPNPYHWMLHEATHQLNTEVARLRLNQWLDEGVACFFGAGVLQDTNLQMGKFDLDAYPIWRLHKWTITGDLSRDLKSGIVIPIEVIVSGTGGPPMKTGFNDYYLHWWSLAHFLFEFHNGKHRAATFELMREGGTLEGFTRLIGEPEMIQKDWYTHLTNLKTRDVQSAQDARIRQLRERN
jgi:hypothetical protein